MFTVHGWRFTAYRFRRLQRPTFYKYRQPPQDRPLVLPKQVPRPIDECLKRLRVINLLKEMGLSLGEIQRILFAKKLQGGNKAAVQYLQGVFSEKLSLVNTKIETLTRMKTEIANALKILQACESCDHKVLLDAILCGECALLESNEAIPDTFKAILQ